METETFPYSLFLGDHTAACYWHDTVCLSVTKHSVAK